MASTTSVPANEQAEAEMKNYGRAALADYFGDFVIYRNLEPLDRRLPGLKAAAYKMNLSSDQIPRKLDTDYAKAAIFFAEQGQKLRRQKTALSELLFIGDTPSGDGEAYANMQQLSGWQGSCFIGCERPQPELVVDIDEEDAIYVANRWAALGGWVQWARQHGMRLDERTVVLVDIDKTALGAKGRNDNVINAARLEGMFRVANRRLVGDLVGVGGSGRWSRDGGGGHRVDRRLVNIDAARSAGRGDEAGDSYRQELQDTEADRRRRNATQRLRFTRQWAFSPRGPIQMNGASCPTQR